MESSLPGGERDLPLPWLVAANVLACVVVALVLWPLLRTSFVNVLTHSLSIGTLALLLIRGGLWLLDRVGIDRGVSGTLLRSLLVPTLAVVAYLAGTVLARTILDLPALPLASFRQFEPDGKEERSLIATVLASLLLTAGFVAYHRYSRLRLQAATSRRMEERSRRQASDARLSMLRAQVEPHMMFNTLATVQALIREDPERAHDMLERFNQFLRATLSGSRSPTADLRSDFDVLENYLSLWKFRLADRLRYRLVLATDLHAYEIPSLLLQPLVENAVRHGIEPAIGGGSVTVTAERVREQVIIVVENTGRGMSRERLRRIASLDESAPHETGGFGLGQLASRLSTFYGTEASFSIESTEEKGTMVTLELPGAGAAVRRDRSGDRAERDAR